MEEGKPGPSTVTPPAQNNNLRKDFESHHLDPAYAKPRNLNLFFDSHGLLKPRQNALAKKDQIGRESHSAPELESEKQLVNVDFDEKMLPPELHAVCLMALFHVNFVCGICNEALVDCICLDCGHNFCTFCIYQWFNHKRVCPVCWQYVKDDFDVQRTYCVDEFVAEMYTSLQELSKEYFGSANFIEPPTIPQILPSPADMQASLQNPRVLNPTTNASRQKLRQLRRAYVSERHPCRDRDDFSILEQQTELLSSPDNATLSSVVQFFLSSITAYITYEGSDSISSDLVLVGAISAIVWYLTFIMIMRLIGYEGSFSELISQLHFIEFFEADPDPDTEDLIQIDNDIPSLNNSGSNGGRLSAYSDSAASSSSNYFQENRVNSSGDIPSSAPSAMEWDTTTTDDDSNESSRSQLLTSGSSTSA